MLRNDLLKGVSKYSHRSVQFRASVVSYSQHHGLQHARLPGPSTISGACSNSSPSSQWWHPTIASCVILFSSSLQSFPASGSFPMSVGCYIRWPNYWSFSFSISLCNGYSGLISFRMDWLDLLAFQETVKNLLQHCSSGASFLLHSAFFMVQFSHPYMTIGKIIPLTIWTFVGNVMSLLLNMLLRFVIAFLPRSVLI